MAWLPPVNIPSLNDGNYAGQLYNMMSGVGDAFYQNRRDKVGDAQWQQEQERLSAAQRQAQSNWEKNYALDLRKQLYGEMNGETDPSIYGSGLYYPDPTSQTGFGYGVWDKSGQMRPLTAPGGPVTVPAGPVTAGGAGWMPQTYSSPGFLPPTTMVTTTAGEQPVSRPGGIPLPGVGPIPNSSPGAIKKQTTISDAGGMAAVNLPTIENMATLATDAIDRVLTNESGLESVTGGPFGLSGILPAQFSMDPEAALQAQADIEQVKGSEFLQAYNALRGAGPLAYQETAAARAAFSTLQYQTVGTAAYRKALVRYREEILKLVEVARQKAQMGADADGAATTQGGGGEWAPAPGGFNRRRVE